MYAHKAEVLAADYTDNANATFCLLKTNFTNYSVGDLQNGRVFDIPTVTETL